MEKYLKGPLEKYLDDVAARLPAPGGGSVSACAAALGAGLFCMVANFTTGEKYRNAEEKINRLLVEMEGIRKRLISLIQEDVEAYTKLSLVYKLAKSTDEEKRIRSEAIQKALKDALSVPLSIARESVRALGTGRDLLEIGNPALISDVGVGAVLLEAALNGAVLNVRINLSAIRDEGFVREHEGELEKLLSGTGALKDELLDGTRKHMEGGKK